MLSKKVVDTASAETLILRRAWVFPKMLKLSIAVLTILVVGTCALKKVKDFGNMTSQGMGERGKFC